MPGIVRGLPYPGETHSVLTRTFNTSELKVEKEKTCRLACGKTVRPDLLEPECGHFAGEQPMEAVERPVSLMARDEFTLEGSRLRY